MIEARAAFGFMPCRGGAPTWVCIARTSSLTFSKSPIVPTSFQYASS